MGAILFWVGVGLVITLILLAAWAVDRRARRTGHQVRDGGDILSEAWEHGRDVDQSGNAFYLGQDLSWSSRSRHTKAATEGGPSAGTRWAASVTLSDDGNAEGVDNQGPEAASSR